MEKTGLTLNSAYKYSHTSIIFKDKHAIYIHTVTIRKPQLELKDSLFFRQIS